MSMNNNINNQQLQRSLGGSSPFRNAATPPATFSQPQIGAGFQSPFQMSPAQALAEAHSKAAAQAQAQAHAQAQAQAQFQAHLQAQALNPRGFSQKPLGRPPGVPMTSSVQPMRTMELTPAARRKKLKLPEKQLQERVAAILPESALYTQLLEFESRIDSALARKKVDIQEALKNPPSVQKTLRIYVFNSFANQIKTIPQKPNAEPPTWTLKIIGRILEDGIDPDQPGVTHKPNNSYPKFSSFFKKVTISLDQRLYPDNHMIIWENARAPSPHEGFEVKRKGDQEFTVNIRLEMNCVPEKFKLSPALTEVVGIEIDTRPRIIAAIWHYVKARKLQNPNDPSFFVCDPPLQRIFGEEKLKFTMISPKISQHLFPPQPIHLEHRIKLSGNNPAGSACYDVLVDVPFPIQRELSALLANAEKTKEIETCDESIISSIRKIHEHRRRRAFFLGFSQSPVKFINALIESQSKDLKIVAGDTNRSAAEETRSDGFNQPWVEDAVIRYLNRKPAAGSEAPGST